MSVWDLNGSPSCVLLTGKRIVLSAIPGSNFPYAISGFYERLGTQVFNEGHGFNYRAHTGPSQTFLLSASRPSKARLMRLCFHRYRVIIASDPPLPPPTELYSVLVDGAPVTDPVPMVLTNGSCVDVNAADLAVQTSGLSDPGMRNAGTLVY